MPETRWLFQWTGDLNHRSTLWSWGTDTAADRAAAHYEEYLTGVPQSAGQKEHPHSAPGLCGFYEKTHILPLQIRRAKCWPGVLFFVLIAGWSKLDWIFSTSPGSPWSTSLTGSKWFYHNVSQLQWVNSWMCPKVWSKGGRKIQWRQSAEFSQNSLELRAFFWEGLGNNASNNIFIYRSKKYPHFSSPDTHKRRCLWKPHLYSSGRAQFCTILTTIHSNSAFQPAFYRKS